MSPTQIVENIQALEVIPKLTPDIIEKIEAAVQSKPKRPESYRWLHAFYCDFTATGVCTTTVAYFLRSPLVGLVELKNFFSFPGTLNIFMHKAVDCGNKFDRSTLRIPLNFHLLYFCNLWLSDEWWMITAKKNCLISLFKLQIFIHSLFSVMISFFIVNIIVGNQLHVKRLMSLIW